MKTFFYDLSGGINKASTKTELGLDTKKLFWSDSKNIEILQNRGVIRQKGNTLIVDLPVDEQIIAMHQMKYAKVYNLLIATETGKLFVFNSENSTVTQLEKTVSGLYRLNFADFLNGVIVSSNDKLLFPIFNQEKTVEIIYYTNKFAQNEDGEDIEQLSSQSDVSIIPMPFAEPVLVYGTCMRLKANPEHSKFNYWFGMYKEAIATLRSKIGTDAMETPQIRLFRN